MAQPIDETVLEKDIFVTLELRAIRNGYVWNKTGPLEMPKQSEASYFVIQNTLSEAMKSIGVMIGQDVLLQETDKTDPISIK